MTTRVSVEELDGLTEQGFVSVGFVGETGLRPLQALLNSVLGKKSNLGKTINAMEDLTEATEETTDALGQMSFALGDTVKKTKDKFKKFQDTLETVTEDIKNTIQDTSKETESILLKFGDIALKTAKAQIQAGMKFVDVHRQLESSGVSVAQGFKGLLNISRETGMGLQDISRLYTSSSKVIAKFNTATGKGVQTFTKLINGIDDNLVYTWDERNSLLQSFMEGRSALEQNFESPEFQKAFNKYTENMKLLSIATGKTVDNLVQEQKLKGNHLVKQTFEATYGSQGKALAKLGLSEELEAYIISGGVKNVKEATLAMANSPVMKNILTSLLSRGATNLDDEYVQNLMESMGKYANAERMRLSSNARNGGMTTAGYMSDEFARMNFNPYGLQTAETARNVSRARDQMASKDNQQQQRILDAQKVQRKYSRMQTEYEYLKAGGDDGWTAAMKINTLALDGLNATLKWTNGLIVGNAINGIAGSVFGQNIETITKGLVNGGTNYYSSRISGQGFKGATSNILKDSKSAAKAGWKKMGGFKGANVLGAGLEAYVAYDKISKASLMKEHGAISENEYKDTRNKAIGNAVGGIGGATIGTYIGGAIGAIGGPIGIAIGSSLGGILGNVVGSWIGEKTGDAFISDKTYMEELKIKEQETNQKGIENQKETNGWLEKIYTLFEENNNINRDSSLTAKMKTNSYTNNQTSYY